MKPTERIPCILFAAANTADGFYSCFGDVFSPERWEKVYIIKGGPGTGKSGFLRAVGAEAERLGKAVRYYACSSDPDSLDGVVIPELHTAFFDGTAPHAAEPRYPGAVEEILNMGMFFDTKRLQREAGHIRELQAQYGEAQRLSSRYLRAAGEMRRTERVLVSGTFSAEKMRRAAQKLLDGIPTEEEPLCTVRFLTAVGKSGVRHLDTARMLAWRYVTVSDRRRCASVFLNVLVRTAEERGISCIRFADYLCPEDTEGCYIPAIGLYVGSDRYEKPEIQGTLCGEKMINPDRFMDPALFAACRARFRFTCRCEDALTEGACGALSAAGELHDALEAIYKAAMDFSEKEAFTARFLARLFPQKAKTKK